MFHVTDEDKFLDLIDSVAAEPIDEEPYSIVKDPKPVVESVCTFDGVQIDLESWSKSDGVATDSNKVGKAKTAPDPKLTKAAPKTSTEKKDDGKLVEKVEVDDKKKKEQVVEVNAEAEVKAEKAPEAGKGGEFDKAAKSAATAQEGDAKSNKKFAKGCDIQTRIDLFKKGVEKLGVDAKSKADTTKILKEFDQISSYLTGK
jgi:hypothetical protein